MGILSITLTPRNENFRMLALFKSYEVQSVRQIICSDVVN